MIQGYIVAAVATVTQGSSHQVWSGQVRSACISELKLGEVWGHEIASETIFGPIRCFSEPRRQSFTCMNIYPFCHCVIQLTGFGVR